MEFIEFRDKLNAKMATMIKRNKLFVTDVPKEDLWDTYLESFPDGTNEIFRERREYDCNCCKRFIRACGNLVSIVDGELESIWDIEVGGKFQPVVDALSKLVKSANVRDIFLSEETVLGLKQNIQALDSGDLMTWDHFYYQLPSNFVESRYKGQELGKVRSLKEVFKRALDEISLASSEIVLEIIEQGSLYRGDEFKAAIIDFISEKKKYDKIPETQRDIYCWERLVKVQPYVAGIRNSVIGTLLVDLSEGGDLDGSVKSYEVKVAPTNYKRPTALVTKSMIKRAQAQVIELGLEDALPRRHAVAEDITINNVIFANRDAKKSMNVFDELIDKVPDKVGNLEKAEEVSIDTFINSIVPNASEIEVLLKNKHESNFMSLISPVNTEVRPLFKWDNNFSWTYSGEVADSIKQRVKAAGGNVQADLRFSLSWFNHDDLDIHVREPNSHIYFANKRSSFTGGHLDVDMNAGSFVRDPVENIVWEREDRLDEGHYQVFVNNFAKRESIDIGFELECEYRGELLNFSYDKPMRHGENVTVARFDYTRDKGVTFSETLPHSTISKEIWGLNTEKFQKVSMIMNSPNHWDGGCTGNKHLFFILENCRNPNSVRGFYNEFLRNDLLEHRKVFEVLGSKMKADYSEKQLSGLGFSSTQRNEVICRVTGSFTRIVKVKF